MKKTKYLKQGEENDILSEIMYILQYIELYNYWIHKVKLVLCNKKNHYC